MTEFLDLGRERAAAADLEMRFGQFANSPERRPAKAPPLDRAVAFRVLAIEEISVFREEKTLYDKRWNAREVAVDRLGKACPVEGATISVKNIESALIPLPIDRECARFHEL